MNDEIVQFIPKFKQDARKNVDDFVIHCRDKLNTFGENLDWDAAEWDVTDTIIHRGRSGRLVYRWTNHDTSKENRNAPLMSQPYLNFARAYLRYLYSMKPSTNINTRMAAVRIVERALSEHGEMPDIVNLTPETLNRAAALTREKYKSGAGYRIGAVIESICKFTSEKGIINVGLVWKNPIKRDSDRNRVGKKFEKDRLDKLPKDGAIEALAKAFNLAFDTNDIIVASTGALLCSSPDRINELFRLPINCTVEKTMPDGSVAFGIRWWPSKGADTYVKWIGSSMVELAKQAIQNIREETEEARKIALWYEENNGKLWLPDDLEYLRKQKICHLTDFIDVIGLNAKGSIDSWAKTNKVEIVDQKNGQKKVRFSDVEAAVLRYLPKKFPIYDFESGLKYSDMLFVTCRNQMQSQRGTIRCMFEPVGTAHINIGLGGGIEHGKSSIFTRLELKHDDGSDIKITTHQFRHWLNTIAQRGGLSQLDIAKWSGRKNVQQNEDYDHVSADELIMMVRNIDDGSMFGPLADVIDKMPVSREDFLKLSFPTAHTTDYGFCIHDYAMLPCQKHRDCINCTEHVCIKGEVEKTRKIMVTLDFINEQVLKAEAAIEEGTAGADRWFVHHKQTAERLQGLVDIFNDNDVPVGSVIQLSVPEEFSPIKNAIDERKSIGDKDADMLNEIRDLIGSSLR